MKKSLTGVRLVALAAKGSGVAGGRVARREATKAADATSLGLCGRRD